MGSPVVITRKTRLPHIPELDGIRGLAALAVLFHHVCYVGIHPQAWGSEVHVFYNLARFGNNGVDIFFVLSGFLITSLLIQDRTEPAYYHNFYWKRVLRILPLYIACLVGIYFLVPHSHAYVLLSALFIVNFAQVFHVVSNGPFWTLAIEEQFYLIWPTVVRRRPVAQLLRWSVGIGLCAVVLRLVAACVGHHNNNFTFVHCDGLAAGAFIACLYSQRGFKGAPLLQTKWIAAAFAAGLLLFPLTFLPYSSKRELAFIAAGYQTGISLLAGAIIAFIIVHTGAPYLAVFRSRLLAFFGLISYAVYMTHIYVLMTYDHFLGPLRPGDTGGYMLRLFTVLAGTVLLSVISYFVLERPALSLRKYVLVRSPQQLPVNEQLRGETAQVGS